MAGQRWRWERVARNFVRGVISHSATFRGRTRPDGSLTLLSVDYHSTPHVNRLIRSYRRFVDASGPVIVVENGPWRDRGRIESRGVRRLTLGANLHHGLALD